MTSNRVPTSNIRRKRIKPENYTPEVYGYFRDHFTINLAYIVDNGVNLETEVFFDLCITDIRNAPWIIPEMLDWFKRRKENIKSIE